MNIISTYREVGTYRGVAELWGTTHKTVKRRRSGSRSPVISMRCATWWRTGRQVRRPDLGQAVVADRPRGRL